MNKFREIPYNYTSADDSQIVKILFDFRVWDALERLRSQRVTGRSAKLLLRFMGDMFILRRNPFLAQELADSPKRLKTLRDAATKDLDIIEKNSASNSDVMYIISRCRAYLEDLAKEFSSQERKRRRLKGVLGSIIGPENVLFDPFTLVSHATDATDWRLYLPLAVVTPSKEEQVGPLLVALGKLGLSAIPRGAGTGLTGGNVPVMPDCVMVNTEKLNQIRGIRMTVMTDEQGRSRNVQVLEGEAGVITENAMHLASQNKLVFATDPTSAWACTLGGNLSENSGGKSAVLWGTAIDNVLSYNISMPGGKEWRVERVNHPLRKILPADEVKFEVWDRATGQLAFTVVLRGNEIRKNGLWKDITNKSLKGLPGLQKEGTDGVITSARFVLYPAYEARATFCLEFFGTPDEASQVNLDLSREFINKGEEALLSVEHFDEEYIQAIDYKVKSARGGRPNAVVLLDMVSHTPEQLERGRQRLTALLEPHKNTYLFSAKDEAEAELFWQDRKKLEAISRRTNAFKLNEDIVLPLTVLAEFSRYIEQFNIDEEQYSHQQTIKRLQEYLEQSVGQQEDGALSAKLGPAAELCLRTMESLGKAGKRQLRESVYLKELVSALKELFAGYGAIHQGMDRVFKEERNRIIVIATHMHAGDGNVHVNIPVLSNDREMMHRAADTADVIMAKAVELGGVVSGEHGIGVTKLKHLEPERLLELNQYRKEVDPQGLMNPGKLSDLEVPDRVFTPSFNLLELEARIIQNGSLEILADKISKCVRCGRCKANCCVFYARQGMFFHPRNKNLAIASLIEALLYDAQRFHSTKYENLKYLEEIADHCTICHKCLAPCPVDIDTGEVSILEREILKTRKFKHSSLLTRMTLSYLTSRSKFYNAMFRKFILRWGSLAQGAASKALRFVPNLMSFKAIWPLSVVRTAIQRPAPQTLYKFLPECQSYQSLLISPERETSATVFYFPGCGSERLYSDISKATLYILLKAGIKVVLPPPFLCCGFPLGVNARRAEQGSKVLDDTIIFSQIREMFRYLNFDSVAVSCGTCMEALKGMAADEIFECGVKDASQLALEYGLRVDGGGNYLYHKPCHDSFNSKAIEIMGRRCECKLEAVPHCCSEAGTLALSRPDISHKMLGQKADAIRSAMEKRPGGAMMLTNCPSCIQGLSRNSGLGIRPRHIAVELARKAGGENWQKELKQMVRDTEVVTF